MMLIRDVEKRVKLIEILVDSGDYEGAHSDEDQLYLDLLTAIANGSCSAPQVCAQVALRTQQLKFDRHCA